MNDSSFIFDATQADFEQSVLAASTQVPVLVDFWAPWCGPCRQLTPVLEQVVASYGGRVLLAKVNTDDQMQLAALFGIRSLPTVMLIKDGRPVDGFMGAQPASVIREILAAHVGEPGEAPLPEAEPEPMSAEMRVVLLREQIAAEPDREELKLELAEALVQTGEVDGALALLDRLPANLAESDRAKKLRSHLEFARALTGAPPRRELERAVAEDPKDLRARHQLGTHLLLSGEHEAALEQFFEIMRTDRSYDEDLGRRLLIAAFDLVPDPELVGATRRRMASLLF
ncbi:MAG TPA: thioredoxin [Candidatus Saccharimonadia bacterium]|nr:thioredoxin [Candidatus Saccharimonadia bacterium]